MQPTRYVKTRAVWPIKYLAEKSKIHDLDLSSQSGVCANAVSAVNHITLLADCFVKRGREIVTGNKIRLASSLQLFLRS